jgi:lipoyl-dependent peroxiredoxin
LPTSSSSAVWEGGLRTGRGHFTAASGAFGGDYSFRTRFEGEKGTNPEELIAAAHAACYSMAFSNGLAKAGFTPTSVETTAAVQFGPVEGGFAITRIDLTSRGDVPGIDAGEFDKIAAEAKAGCPISKALAAVEITLDAKLV